MLSMPGCRDRPTMPFRCLDAQYRRELVRVYLTNVETICRKFVEERREALARLRDDSAGLRTFWGYLSPVRRQKLASERGEVLLKVRSLGSGPSGFVLQAVVSASSCAIPLHHAAMLAAWRCCRGF